MRDLLGQRGVGGDVGGQRRLPAHNEVGDHAAENGGAAGVDVGLVAVGEVVPVSYTHLTLPTICSV